MYAKDDFKYKLIFVLYVRKKDVFTKLFTCFDHMEVIFKIKRTCCRRKMCTFTEHSSENDAEMQNMYLNRFVITPFQNYAYIV